MLIPFIISTPMSTPCCLQVPEQIYLTDKLPKTATGKIQRRMMVEAFVKGDKGQQAGTSQGKASQPRSRL